VKERDGRRSWRGEPNGLRHEVGPSAKPQCTLRDALGMVVVREHAPFCVAQDQVVQLVGATELTQTRRARAPKVVEGGKEKDWAKPRRCISARSLRNM
jgi:hypothetical protein